MKLENLFIALCKYKPTENITPLENFTTEAFVYVLNALKKDNNTLFRDILSLFNIEDYLEIETQCVHQVTIEDITAKLIPDIQIKDKNGNYTFIEVKVDSSLHGSKLGLKDQLMDYRHITVDGKIGEVFSLTKEVIYSDSINDKNKIRWSQIIEMLEKTENDIVYQFKEFLISNNMADYSSLQNDITTIKVDQQNFNNMIQLAFDSSKFGNSEIYRREEVGYIYSDGNGWYINNADSVPMFWIGCIPNRYDYSSVVIFEIMYNQIENFSNISSVKKAFDGNYILENMLSFPELLNESCREKQIERIKDWLNDIYKKIHPASAIEKT